MSTPARKMIHDILSEIIESLNQNFTANSFVSASANNDDIDVTDDALNNPVNESASSLDNSIITNSLGDPAQPLIMLLKRPPPPLNI